MRKKTSKVERVHWNPACIGGGILGKGCGFLIVLGICSSLGGQTNPPPAAKELPTSAPSTSQPVAQEDALPPPVAPEDLALLVKSARKAFRSALEGEASHPRAGYRPAELNKLSGIVHLVLRKHGAVVLESESSEMPIADAAMAAGALLGKAAKEKKISLQESGNRMGLEFEWLGPWRPIQVPYFQQAAKWSDELLHSFEPAVEGIGVELRGLRGWTRPSQIMSLNYSPDLALKGAEAAIGLKQIHKLRFPSEIKYIRCWAFHLWQADASSPPCQLFRGDVLIVQESVAATSIDEAIGRFGSYVHFRQNDNGSFADEYLPSADVYNERNSAEVQLAALFGQAVYSNWSGDASAKAGVEKSLDAFGKYVIPLAQEKVQRSSNPGSIFAPPGHGRHLEISARLLLASVVNGANAGRADMCQALIRGILATQSEDGRFVLDDLTPTTQPEPTTQSVFTKSNNREVDVANGWVCFALARAEQTEETLRSDIENALNRAAVYYQHQPLGSMHPEAIVVLARAFALHYASTNDARLSDFTFAVADRLVVLQVTSETCPYPELFGAINVRTAGDVGADSATYLAVLADALLLAQRIGDQARVTKYRPAVERAVRFIMQLEVHLPGTYFMRTPKAALGGVRIAPWNNRIRVDDCADALECLIRSREALYGPRNP